MRQSIVIALACALALFAGPASAQRIIQPREGIRPTTMTPPAYAEADRVAGVQGSVSVRGMVWADGSIADVTVVESSHSATLDDASLAAVRQWTFAPVETATSYEVQIEYRKDDLNTLATKTCSDLNTDVAYFRGAFPDAPTSDMPLKDLLVGMMMVTNRGGMTVENIRRSSEAFDRTIEWCSTRSSELMLERYIRFAR